jgi:RNA polymerase sigma-70 factor (ECF subfamily)
VEVRELLSSLPPKYGAVMYLYLYENRTVEEIAALLDKKINTVKSLIRRGKAKLKIELADEKQTTKQGSVRRTEL